MQPLLASTYNAEIYHSEFPNCNSSVFMGCDLFALPCDICFLLLSNSETCTHTKPLKLPVPPSPFFPAILYSYFVVMVSYIDFEIGTCTSSPIIRSSQIQVTEVFLSSAIHRNLENSFSKYFMPKAHFSTIPNHETDTTCKPLPTYT